MTFETLEEHEAAEAAKEAAKKCSNPIHGYRTSFSRRTGRPVGKVRDHVLIRCGTRIEAKCPACSETYRKRATQLIMAGLPQPNEAAIPYLLTFTAPSFGKVHRYDNCPCGNNHKKDNREDTGLIGAPLDPTKYGYSEQVDWHLNLSDLWAATRHRITRLFEDYHCTILRVAELQKRGAIHFHVLVVIRQKMKETVDPETDELIRAPAGIMLPFIGKDLEEDLVETMTDSPIVSNGRTWGSQMDIKTVVPKKNNGELTYAPAAAYLAKYLTKATNSMLSVPPDSAIERHLFKLERLGITRWEVRKTVELKRPVASHELKRAQTRTFAGFAGHCIAKSPSWGVNSEDSHPMTMKRLKEQARIYRGYIDPGEQTKVLWELDFQGSGNLCELRSLLKMMKLVLPPPFLPTRWELYPSRAIRIIRVAP